MKIEGYKADNYNATYNPALFDVRKGRENAKSCVLIIEDMESGMEFILELEKRTETYDMINKNLRKKPRTRGWQPR